MSDTPASPITDRVECHGDREVGVVGSRNEWQVSCRDVAGRRRDMTIMASDGRVVVVAPPGELAVLAPFEVGRLRAALRDAVFDAQVAAER